jgi:hypothetical protein
MRIADGRRKQEKYEPRDTGSSSGNILDTL